jgi:hypothetical protein
MSLPLRLVEDEVIEGAKRRILRRSLDPGDDAVALADEHLKPFVASIRLLVGPPHPHISKEPGASKKLARRLPSRVRAVAVEGSLARRLCSKRRTTIAPRRTRVADPVAAGAQADALDLPPGEMPVGVSLTGRNSLPAGVSFRVRGRFCLLMGGSGGVLGPNPGPAALVLPRACLRAKLPLAADLRLFKRLCADAATARNHQKTLPLPPSPLFRRRVADGSLFEFYSDPPPSQL